MDPSDFIPEFSPVDDNIHREHLFSSQLVFIEFVLDKAFSVYLIGALLSHQFQNRGEDVGSSDLPGFDLGIYE